MTVASTSATTAAASGAQGTGRDYSSLGQADFLRLLTVQLQQQDPTEPAKNDQLLAQMSQISQLQSSSDLTTSLKGMVQQNQIGSAATLIGKKVTGMDAANNTISGTVTSVRVTDDGANVELDNGQSLAVTRVTAIAAGPRPEERAKMVGRSLLMTRLKPIAAGG